MTNPFASDADPSLGHSTDTPESTGETIPATDIDPSSPEDVTSTLAELEHKLLELERELSAIDKAGVSAPTAPPADVTQPAVGEQEETPEAQALAETEPETASRQPARSEPKLIDESLLGDSQVAERSEAEPAAADEPEPASYTQPVHFVDEVLEPEPPATWSETPTVHADSPSSTVIAELEGFHHRLQELSDDYGALLAKLTVVIAESEVLEDPEVPGLDEPEAHEALAVPQMQPAPVDSTAPAILEHDPPAVPEEPTTVEPALVDEPPVFEPSPATFGQPTYFEADQTSDEDIPEVSFHAPPSLHGTPAAPDAGSPEPPASDAAPQEPVQEPQQAPVREPSPEDEAMFVEHVEIGVGPFYDIASLSAFEREIAQVPNVTETAVRRFEASHAVIDLHLTAPTALVSELRAVATTPFNVRQLAASRLALTFDES